MPSDAEEGEMGELEKMECGDKLLSVRHTNQNRAVMAEFEMLCLFGRCEIWDKLQ